MLLELWKYIRGYVIISVSGFSPERFINLCANKGIYIWDIKRVKTGFELCISAKGFKLLRPIAKKTRCNVKIQRKIGLPFRFLIFRKRRIFLFGTIISVIIVFILSLFIWKIEFVGNTRYTDEQLLKFLTKESHTIGMWKHQVDIETLEKQMLKEYPYINWVTCEVDGTKLIVYMEEGHEVVRLEDISKPCDIIADKNGIIVSIITRTGTPNVAKGDVILEGDVLVSGTLEIKELDQLKAVDFTHSDADIYIKTSYDYFDELEMRYVSKQFTGESKKDYTFELFSAKINLFKPSIKYAHYDKIDTKETMRLFDNFYLPFHVHTTSYEEYDVIEQNYSEEEAMNIINNRLDRYIRDLEKDKKQILSRDINIQKSTNNIIASGKLIVLEKVGIKQYFNDEERRHEYDEYFREDDGDSS